MPNEPRPENVRCILFHHGNPYKGELALTWCGNAWKPPITSAFMTVSDALDTRYKSILRVCPQCSAEVVRNLQAKTWLSS